MTGTGLRLAIQIHLFLLLSPEPPLYSCISTGAQRFRGDRLQRRQLEKMKLSEEKCKKKKRVIILFIVAVGKSV